MSSIEWTEETWNPTTGCSHFSKWGECDNCYAEVMSKRLQAMGQKHYAKGFNTVMEHEDALNIPHKWKKPRTVFVNSMSDLFHKEISLEFIQKVFRVMNDTPRHTYQILTKRDALLKKYSKKLNWTDNIWMGVSVGAQGATRRIKNLVASDAQHKFLSIEPFIDEIADIDLTGIDWVIVGGESGSNARPMKKEWVHFIKDKCNESGVPFFFKQWGDKKWNPNPDDPTMNGLHRYYAKGGCQLDGKVYWSNPSIPDFKTPTIKLFGKEYYVMDEMVEGGVTVKKVVTLWELKSYLPASVGNKYEELKADIKENGLNDPVLYWRTPNDYDVCVVIEGHTRIRACKAVGASIRFKEIEYWFNSIDDIKLWMVRHQLQRRNLSNIERVKYAFMSKDAIQEQARENLARAGRGEDVESIDTYEEIAKLAGVGRTTVVRYNDVITKGSKTTIKQLYDGKLSISSAHAKIKVDLDTREEQPPPTLNEPIILVFDNIEDGINAFEQGEIDDFLITRFDSASQILKKKAGRKIGIFIQPT